MAEGQISLVTQTAQVDPGNQVDVMAVVRNLEAKPADFGLSVRGIEPSWVTLRPPTLTLGPRQESVVHILVRPPSDATSAIANLQVRLNTPGSTTSMTEATVKVVIGSGVSVEQAASAAADTRPILAPPPPRPLRGPLAIGGGALVIAMALGLFYMFHVRGASRKPPPAAPVTCAQSPSATASLYSDDRTTALLFSSSPDLSDLRILRTEPADTLPGLFDSLLSLSTRGDQLAFVTASDPAMDDATIMSLSVNSPATTEQLAHLTAGFWPVRPAWSPDDKQVAYVALDQQQSSQQKAVLDLWTVAKGQQPVNHFTFDGLQPEAFYGNHATLCWAVDNRTLIFDSLKTTKDGRSQQVELDTVTNKVRIVPKYAPPTATPSSTATGASGGAQEAGTGGSSSTSTKCDLAVYSQNDPRWRNEIMRSAGDHIGPFGCALTSTAMLLNYYGANITPAQLNRCLGSAADLLYWNQAPPCSNGTTKFAGESDFTWDNLDNILKAGEPAIVGMVRGQTGMHFIVVTGGQGQVAANYSVTDPWDGTTTKSLQTFMNAGYVLKWVIQYTGNTNSCVRTGNASPNPGGPTVTAPDDGSITNDNVTIDVSGDTSNATVEVVNLSDSMENTSSSGELATSATPSGSPSSNGLGSPTSTGSPTATNQGSPAASGSPTATATASTAPGKVRLPVINLPLKFIKIPPRVTLTKDGFYLLVIAWRTPDGRLLRQQRTFMIDHTPPTLTVQGQAATAQVQLVSMKSVIPVVASSTNEQFPGSANLEFDAWDGVSGVALVEYRLDGGDWQAVSDDVSFKRVRSIATQGDHVVKARARDVAGNVSGEVEFDFTVLPSTQSPPMPTTSPTTVPSVTSSATSTSTSTTTPGGGHFTLMADHLDFGDQPVSMESSPLVVTVKNTGTAPLTLGTARLSGSAGDFSVRSQCPKTLGPNTSCSFTVTFKPTVAGTRQATVDIVHSDPSDTAHVSLIGTGLKRNPGTPNPVAAPVPVDFGGIQVRSKSDTKTVTVSNTGDGVLTISGINLQGSATGDFIVGSSGNGHCSGASVKPGDHCKIDIQFVPTAAGDRQAQIVVSHNGPNGRLLIDLIGVGTSPRFAVDPAALDFGIVEVGDSRTLRFSVKNSGDAPLRFGPIVPAGANADQFVIVSTATTCSGTLDPNNNCLIVVQFSPTTADAATASVAITDNASGSPQQVPLSGTGSAPSQGALNVDPAALDFGSVVVGTETVAEDVTVKNSGNAVLRIGDVTIVGDASPDYVDQSDPQTICTNRSLEPGQTCVVSIQFVPKSEGKRQAQISINHDGTNSPTTVALSGTGTVAEITVSPTSLSFGSFLVNAGGSTQTLTVTNSGTATLTGFDTAITGDAAGDFSIRQSGDSDCANYYESGLAPGQSCTYTIDFVPRSTGDRNAQFVIYATAPNSPATVALSGNGRSLKIPPITPPTFGTAQQSLTVVLQTSNGDVLSKNNNSSPNLMYGNTSVVLVANVANGNGVNSGSVQGLTIDFLVSGPSVGSGDKRGAGITDANGNASFSYVVTWPSSGTPTSSQCPWLDPWTDTVEAWVDYNNNENPDSGEPDVMFTVTWTQGCLQ